MGLTRRTGRAEGGETCFSEARWETGEEGKDGGREGGRCLIFMVFEGRGDRDEGAKKERQDKKHARIHFL